jgi:hypothetical protein
MTITKSDLKFKHSITIAFTEGLRVLESEMSPRPDSEGQFNLVYTLGGGGEDKWFVVGMSDSITVIVYLGSNQISNYRGGYILKNSDTALTADEIQFVKNSLQSSGSGVTYEEFCHTLIQ